MIKVIKEMFKNDIKTNLKMHYIEPNYEGIAQIMAEFEKLYKVCDNKEMLDRCFEGFFKAPKSTITDDVFNVE